jgi:hypothetical protein
MGFEPVAAVANSKRNADLCKPCHRIHRDIVLYPEVLRLHDYQIVVVLKRLAGDSFFASPECTGQNPFVWRIDLQMGFSVNPKRGKNLQNLPDLIVAQHMRSEQAGYNNTLKDSRETKF